MLGAPRQSAAAVMVGALVMGLAACAATVTRPVATPAAECLCDNHPAPCALPAAPASEPERRAAAEQHVRSVLEAQVSDWNRGDLAAFCAWYAEDATYMSPSGVVVGRAAIEERYRQRHQEPGRILGTLSFELLDVRLASELDGASVVLAWRLRWDGRPDLKGQALVVLGRTAEGWRILHDASM